MDHKTLMNIVIILAIVHAVLSLIIGSLLVSKQKMRPEILIIFCVVSVIVNILIFFFANKCKNETKH